MSRGKSTPLCRRLLRRLTAEHGCKFKRPIEDYWIGRLDDAILANTREGMDYTTWCICAPNLESPRVWHQRWNKPGRECGYVECVIDSADPVSKLARSPFMVRASHGHLELALGAHEDDEA